MMKLKKNRTKVKSRNKFRSDVPVQDRKRKRPSLINTFKSAVSKIKSGIKTSSIMTTPNNASSSFSLQDSAPVLASSSSASSNFLSISKNTKKTKNKKSKVFLCKKSSLVMKTKHNSAKVNDYVLSESEVNADDGIGSVSVVGSSYIETAKDEQKMQQTLEEQSMRFIGEYSQVVSVEVA